MRSLLLIVLLGLCVPMLCSCEAIAEALIESAFSTTDEDDDHHHHKKKHKKKKKKPEPRRNERPERRGSYDENSFR